VHFLLILAWIHAERALARTANLLYKRILDGAGWPAELVRLAGLEPATPGLGISRGFSFFRL